jgi:hypothetical protein
LCTDFTLARGVRGLVGPALIVLVALGGGRALAAAPVDHDDAPFEVVAFSATHVRVDIGADKASAQPLRTATILTASGPVPATLVRARRTCVSLCGEDDEKTCHYEAILRTSGLPARPLAVMAGTQTVTGVSTIADSPNQPIESEQRWLDAAPFIEEGESYRESYRWQRFPDGVYLSRSPSDGRNFYAPPISLAGCAQRSISPFTLLTCGLTREGAGPNPAPAEFLYEGRNAIVFSVGEYSTARARPVLRFTLNGKEAVLIRLGLKAEEIAALLVREGTSWRLAAGGADYPTMC